MSVGVLISALTCCWGLLQYVLVTLKTDVPLSFGGTEQPGAYGELLSIGAIGGATNKALSKAISGILEAKLGVPPNRFYLSVRFPRLPHHPL